METKRHRNAWDADKEELASNGDYERGPNGRRLCRVCRQEVPANRQTFCGNQECLREWWIRSNSDYARRMVFERDQGVCVLCGIDTVALNKRLRELAFKVYPDRILEQDGVLRSALGKDWTRSSFWDMDHIVPVIEGGGSCGLDNLRTLCIWCHRRATRLLARRRADQRSWARIKATGQMSLLGEV